MALGDRFADLGRFAAEATAALVSVDGALLMLDGERRVVHLNPAAKRLLTPETLPDGSFGRVDAANSRLVGELTA